MRVLLDENLPLDFAAEILGHEVITVRAAGWAGLQNGALMKRAATACDVFVTMDKNIPFQQNIPALPFAVILLLAHSNQLTDLRPRIPELLLAIKAAQPGVLQRVGV